MNSPSSNAFVLLNPRARAGRAVHLWRSVADKVIAIHGNVTTCDLDQGGMWRSVIADAYRSGTRWFIGAGGDGTVGSLVNELLPLSRSAGILADHDVPVEHRVAVGAVGLGSSNDFHKPIPRGSESVPLRISRRTERRKIIEVRWLSPDGCAHSRYVAVSASAGFSAIANETFNNAGKPLRVLRSHLPQVGIAAAVTSTLLRHRNRAVWLDADGTNDQLALTSLTVAVTPWVSGSMRYDIPMSPHDGKMLLATCAGMGRGGVLHVLADLSRGRFSGKAGRTLRMVNGARIRFASAETLELDGESVVATEAEFRLVPGGVDVCT